MITRDGPRPSRSISLGVVIGLVLALTIALIPSRADAAPQELACGRLLEYQPPPSDNLDHGYGHVRLSTATGDRAVLFHHVNPSNTPSRTEPGATQMGADICISGPYEHIVGRSPYVSPYDLRLAPAGGSCAVSISAVPTSTVHLPNVTKTLGGIPAGAFGASHGWQTPFIVQNTGSALATFEVTFYRFSDGECVTRRIVSSVAPGTSYAHIPNQDAALPDNSQFAVVVRSFGSTAVAVVNQHKNDRDIEFGTAEAMAYGGFNGGATRVFLPNVTRRFFGYVTPFIIQNLGSDTTRASASFVSFDGSSTLTVDRTIAPGRSQFIDPNSEPGLIDGKQYAVSVTSVQPIAVVENVHREGVFARDRVSYAVNGIARGASAVYGPYAAKNANGVGRVSTIVVQNVGTTPVRPTLTFTAIAGTVPAEPIPAPTQTFLAPAEIAPGGSWAFDPRFTLGTTTPCSVPRDQPPVTVANATCLRDGEYSFVATANGPIAAVVNVISASSVTDAATAMGYTATPRPDTRYFLPNVTKTLGGPSGWTTPILVQAVTASGATLRFYRFSDGALVTTHTVAPPRIAAGQAARIDPRSLLELPDDTQYSVVVEATGGTVTAVVVQLDGSTSPVRPNDSTDPRYHTFGDNAMIYEGFPATAAR